MTTIPSIPENLQNLPVLRAFLDVLRSSVINDINNAGGGGGDKFAADRIVSLDPLQGTDTTIQSAINNLPVGGGTIYIKSGVYLVTSTINCTDKNIRFDFARGSKISIGSNAISVFTIPDIITTKRLFIFSGGEFEGDGTTINQKLLTYNDSTSQAEVRFNDTRVLGTIETLLDVQAYDVTFTRWSTITFFECDLYPTSLGTSTLIKTPAVAGSFMGLIAAEFNDCNAFDFDFTPAITRFWGLNADADLAFRQSNIMIAAGSAVNGLYGDGSSIDINSGDFTVNGAGVAYQVELRGCLMFGLAGGPASRLLIKNSFQPAFFESTTFSGTTLRVETTPDTTNIVGCYFVGSATANVGIDCNSTARVHIDGCEFSDPNGGHTLAAIRLANSTSCIISGCRFEEGPGVNTILETGTSDNNLVTGCIGIGSGGGFSLPGINSLVGLDNIG